MTYDKENSNGMNKLQHTGQSRDVETESPMLEGERVVMSKPGRIKRKGSLENKLSGIIETSETRTNTKNSVQNLDHTKQPDEDRLPSDTIDESENGLGLQKSKVNKTLNQASTSTEKGIQSRDHDQMSTGEMSQNTSLRSSGSGLRNSDLISTKSNTGRNFNPVKFGMEDNSEISERLKNLSEDEHSESKHSRGIKDYSHSHTGSSSRENSVKLPDVKCKHLAASKATAHDAAQKKRLKENARGKEDPDKCMICEITEATANNASVEANRLMLEVVYPHEFYDKFQRSGKRTKGAMNPKFPENPKLPISICKPVKVASKAIRRERSSFSIQPSVAMNLGTNVSRNDQNEASDNEQSPHKRIKTDREHTFKKEMHLQCKAKRNALVITDDSEGQKLILKGLKGWMTKKEDTCKNTVHKEIKQSLYQVNSLGIQFSIPGYYSVRSDKQQTLRPFTCMETPRPIDAQQAIRRPVTDNYNSEKSLDESDDDVITPMIPHHSLRLRRSITNVPKLFAAPLQEEDLQNEPKAPREHLQNNIQKSFQKGVTFYKSKSRLSLPPIGNDLKSRSLTLGQF